MGLSLNLLGWGNGGFLLNNDRKCLHHVSQVASLWAPLFGVRDGYGVLITNVINRFDHIERKLEIEVDFGRHHWELGWQDELDWVLHA